MTPTPSPANCPKCGTPLPADSPRGLCPACLMDAAGGVTEGAPEAQPLELETLRQAFPQFEIIAPLGAGGMGRVYKVRQPNLDRIVALKVLPPELARDAAWVERFTLEARALARLNHPNIVQVFDVGQTTGPDGAPLCWLLMEYVDGVTLRQVQRTGGLSAREALALVPKLCDALQYAHEKGVLHRDIKPENILLDAAGTVKIADFGLAKLTGPGVPSALTQIGARLGTAAYMAPEQIESPGDVDHRADIYSLGVVLYELLTGGLPLGRFPAPSEKSGTDPRLDHVVFRTLEKERERRYQAAGEVRTALEDAQKGSRTGAACKIPPRKMRERESRRPVPEDSSATGRSPRVKGRTVILLLLAGVLLGFFISPGAAILLIIVGGIIGVGVWMIVAMNVDNRRGLAAMSGRTEMVRKAQPHGCVAMLAFAFAMVLVLLPPAVASWLLLEGKRNIPWTAGTAACGLLSFAALQPLLRLTGMHRSATVQRRGAWLMLGGIILCALGMAGSTVLDNIWLPGRQVAYLQWGASAKVTRPDVNKAVEEVFGDDARCITISESRGREKSGTATWKLSAAGAAASGIAERLLLCAAKFNAMDGAGSVAEAAATEVQLKTPQQVRDLNVSCYVVPFWVMAGGAWLLGVHARSRRKWVAPVAVLVLLGSGVWGLEGWHPVIPELMPLYTSAPAESEADLKLPDLDLEAAQPRSTVLRWLTAIRRRDDKTAKECEAYIFDGMHSPGNWKEKFRTARLLKIEASLNEASRRYVDCQLALPKDNPGGETSWKSSTVRFYFYGDQMLLQQILFQ